MKVIHTDTGFEFEIHGGNEQFNSKDILNLSDIIEVMDHNWSELPNCIRSKRKLLTTYYSSLEDIILENFDLLRYKSVDIGEVPTSKVKGFEIIGSDDSLNEFPRVEMDVPDSFQVARILSRFLEGVIRNTLKECNGITINDYGYDSQREEYLLNSWVPTNERINFKKVDNVYNTFENKIEPFEHEYIPNHGQSDTIFGELLRCCQRVIYRFFNDGDRANLVTDGNTISLVNIPFLCEFIESDEHSDYFLQRFNDLVFNRVNVIKLDDIGCLLFESCDTEDLMIQVIKLEVALIETRSKFDNFLEVKNSYDSRLYLE